MNLPDHQRIPLVLFHFEDMSYEEIAKELRISMPKLKTDISRGRAALAKALARKGVTSHES
jgi:RNA polymerase sigma-70 factor (ECF subfamily)